MPAHRTREPSREHGILAVMPPRIADAMRPRRLAWSALLLACAPAPSTPPPPVALVEAPVAAPVDATIVTPDPAAAPASAATPAPPKKPACTTIPIASTWQAPVSPSKPRALVEEPRVPTRGRPVVKLVQRTLAQRCPGLAPPEFDSVDGTDVEGATWLGARPVAKTALLLYRIVSGNGVTAEHSVDVTHYDLAACTTTSLNIEYYDSGLTGRLFGTPPSSLLTQIIGPEHDPGDPTHAYATLLTTTGDCAPAESPDFADDAPRAGAPDLELLPLPFSEQPWFPGRPRPQARVWKQVQQVDDQTHEPIHARVIEPPTPPRRLRVIDDLELFGADIPGRNGGLALALYDPRGDRHRWLLVTRDCLQGTSLHWLAAGSGLAIGYAASGHPAYWEEGRDGLFALDLTNARAYRLLLSGASLLWELPEAQDEQGRLTPGQPPPEPGDVGEPAFEPNARQIGRLRKDATTLRTRCGASVPLSAIRAAIDAGVPAAPRP